MVHISRPLSGKVVEATGKSFSDHEALAAILSFGEINAVHNNSSGLPDLDLRMQIRQVLDAELQSSKMWSILHLLTVVLVAFILAYASYRHPTYTIVLAFFALPTIAFGLSMVSVYLERQCSLKAAIQSHFFGLVQGSSTPNNTKKKKKA